MDYKSLNVTLRDGIGTITLNRPDVRNALNPQMRAEITYAFRDLAKEARVIVLTGAGNAFCSGQDLGEGVSAGNADLERILRDEYVPMLRAIFECPVPTIAAVNGAAAGAGANLALACDVVIATESAVFLQAFTRIGLIPDAGGTYWLPKQIGFARAMGAALFAEPVSAQQAQDWGMIWEAVDDEQFEEHWKARATHLANGPTRAYTSLKDTLRASYNNTLDEQLALEAKHQGKMGQTRDFKEGVVSFLKKKPAKFEGR
ncbi:MULTISPECIES: enoyl-CoA hydratase-related protein [Halocynthiibacter]|uniref:Enoyl-CoA hydratase-related protein n=1 Tax=Halocynthiibacter halioticoli TaxID=2986804 RepID=A0AAE3IY58_9RHOB|nr:MULTISPECIES: enoyl-CoA hydratase-related protein [Halocynthiibacter]MCV6824169.1 enoyl-CoA hydratase-related protein [Halocynthiibacter halioticoli]MCW4057170.1 enoyl-CoA hydratase-related protein [Halocynthiibacter sp. SDUM655004]MDE0589800.1 enoyl-CoA hydratase-related protein [Halocynthiibacter sp. C4]